MIKKVFQKKEVDPYWKLRELDGDEGFMKFLIAEHSAIPFEWPHRDANPASLSSLSNAKKAREASFKKMKRRLKKQFPNGWKNKWEETKKSIKAMEKGQKVPTGYPPPQVIGNPYGQFELRDQVTGKIWVRHKPMNLPILAFIWLTKSYFKRLTKAKTGKPRPCWNLIAEFLEFLPNSKRTSGTDIASWLRKAKKVFEPWDGDASLESYLAFYHRHKAELDIQSKEILEKVIDWLTKVEESESEKECLKTKEKYLEFSE